MMPHEHFADEIALHALGLLPPAEAARLQSHLAQCAACRQELARARGDLAVATMTAEPVQPPAHVRERLLRQLRVDAAPAPRQRRFWFGWVAAPVAAAVVFAFLWLGARRDGENLHRELQQARQQVQQDQKMLAQAREVVETLTAEHAVRIGLVAAGSKPVPYATAVYDPRQGKLVLLASNLEPVPEGKTYELWLLPASGNPIPAGLFKPDARGTAHLVNSAVTAGVQIKGFAVTIEPEGGRDVPTMPIVLAGMAGEE